MGGSTITPHRLGGVFNLGGVFDYAHFPFFISQLIVVSKAPTVGVCVGYVPVRRHGLVWIVSEGSAGAVCS